MDETLNRLFGILNNPTMTSGRRLDTHFYQVGDILGATWVFDDYPNYFTEVPNAMSLVYPGSPAFGLMGDRIYGVLSDKIFYAFGRSWLREYEQLFRSGGAKFYSGPRKLTYKTAAEIQRLRMERSH